MPLVRQGPGLIGTAARSAVFAGVSGRVAHRQQQRWAAEEQQQMTQAAPMQQAPPAAAPDYTAELEKLAQLRDQGVISAEDFEAKKKQLLGI
jgi:hypothetical protein